MDKASMSAKSYEEQQNDDKANKGRNFLSVGFAWLKTQFSSGSHHVVEQAKPIESIIEPVLVKPVSENPIEMLIEKPVEKKSEKLEKPKKHEHEHKHRHKHPSLSKGTSRKTLKAHNEQSESKINTVSERSHSRKKKRQSGSHVSFNLENTETFSALSGSEDHDLMPPVKKNMLVDIKPVEPLLQRAQPTVETAHSKVIESKIELPNLVPDLLEETSVPVMFEPVSEFQEIKPQEQLQAMLESVPQEKLLENAHQSEPEIDEPGEDFSRAIRHRAFEKHKRNSQRLSGQLPNYDESAFIEGGLDVDFIRIQNGTGRYWNHPGKPGQMAGQINHDVMDGVTYQRLGYLASLGDAEAHEKIEAAKNKNGAFKK